MRDVQEFRSPLPADEGGPGVRAVERLVDAFAGAGAQPGLAYGIVAGGRLVHAGGRGVRAVPAPTGNGTGRGTDGGTDGGTVPDADAVFRIASMTKSFTAATLLLLRDEGLLGLDDDAARWVPELAGLVRATADAPPLTLRTLLTMAGGLPTDDPWGDRQQGLPAGAFSQLLRGGLSFAWAPGTTFEYSNLSYAILGRVVEAVTGLPYRDAVTTRLLAPLGMSATVFTAQEVPAGHAVRGHRQTDGRWEPVPFDPYGAFAPMGGLFSSVRDLATWVAGFLDAWPPRDDPQGAHPLSRASRREQQQPHRALAPQVQWSTLHAPPVVRGAAYGFGLVVEHDAALGEVVGHSGGYPGFGSHMRWHPASGLGVVVLGNGTYAPAVQLAARLLGALARPDGGRRGARGGTVPPVAPWGSARPWSRTLAARTAVEQLLHAWDDAVAADLFADNVDLDEPLPRRRDELARARDLVGPLDPAAPDASGGEESRSPAHLAWWVRGRRGRLRLELRMTPEQPPRVQSLAVTPVPDPSPALRAAADAIAGALGQEHPRWPAELPPSGPLDAATARRTVLAGAAWAGACAVGGVTACDGDRTAAFELLGVHADLVLDLTLDGSGGVARASLLPISAG